MEVVEGIGEPVDADLARLLRRAVLDHVRSSPGRHVAAALHVGTPGAAYASVDADVEALVDVVAALRVASGQIQPLVWLTRAAVAGLQDVDARWLAAARAAYAEADVALTFVVVTRVGWWDPRSDVRRTWRRLR
jgi:hypothetical protein